MRTFLTAILFWLVTVQYLVGVTKQPGVVRGTINFIAADENGIVAVTDSRLTEMRRESNGNISLLPLPQPGQKLFRIDDQTICTIAGYVQSETPDVPEFLNQTAAIVQDFRDQLGRQKGPTTVEDKLNLLRAVFSFYLSGIGDIRRIEKAGNLYEFQSLIAGYNPDGKAQVGYMWLDFEATRNGNQVVTFERIKDQAHVFPVEHKLIVLFAGQTRVAEDMLKDSAAWQHEDSQSASYMHNCLPIDDSGLSWACDSSAGDHSPLPPLSLLQMAKIGLTVKDYVSGKNATVGGPSQVASLAHGRIERFDAPEFPSIPKATIGYYMFVGGGCGNSAGPYKSHCIYIDDPIPHIYLYFNYRFKYAIQNVDDGVFSGTLFENSEVHYEGGSLRFGKSNQIVNSDLVIGTAVKDSCEAKHLVQDFVWKSTKFQTPQTKGKRCNWMSPLDRVVDEK